MNRSSLIWIGVIIAIGFFVRVLPEPDAPSNKYAPMENIMKWKCVDIFYGPELREEKGARYETGVFVKTRSFQRWIDEERAAGRLSYRPCRPPE